MDPEAADIARRTAVVLANEFGSRLPAEVETIIGGDATHRQYLDPASIALATLVLNVSKFVWDIYKDSRKSGTAPPAPEVMQRRIRLEIDIPEGATSEQRARIAAAAVAELPRS